MPDETVTCWLCHAKVHRKFIVALDGQLLSWGVLLPRWLAVCKVCWAKAQPVNTKESNDE